MQFADTWPIGMVWAAVAACLWAAFELGRFLRRRSHFAGGQSLDTKDIGFLVPSAFGLLSLLIGFTFSLALNRYESRRDLIVAEAAQIRLAALRAEALPAPADAAMAGMLRAYVGSRLAFFEVGTSPTAIRTAQANSDRLQDQMWREVRAAGALPGGAQPARDVADALAPMIAIGMQRETAAVERIPARVLDLLFLFALLAMTILGHGTGATPGRPWTPSLAFTVIVSAAIVLIVDLDRPRSGDIRVSQAPMLELHASLRASGPPASAAGP